MSLLRKNAVESEKAKEVAAEKASIIEKKINNKIKKGNRRGLFDIAINGTIVYSDDGEPIYLANYLNSSMPYGQRKGFVDDFKKTLNGVSISRSELGLIESNATIAEIDLNANLEKRLIIPIKSKANTEKGLIIPNRLSPINIEQEHISIEPLRKGFQIPRDLGSSFSMIREHHRQHTNLMTWLLTSDFGYTPDKLDALAWYADYLKPLYIQNLKDFYTTHPKDTKKFIF